MIKLITLSTLATLTFINSAIAVTPATQYKQAVLNGRSSQAKKLINQVADNDFTQLLANTCELVRRNRRSEKLTIQNYEQSLKRFGYGNAVNNEVAESIVYNAKCNQY